jgi:hypothetical protein
MRLLEFTILSEGGNIFKDENKVPVTVRINKKDVDPTLKWLEKIVGLDLVNNKLGTTGKNESSGDLDIAVDESKVSKEEVIERLQAWTDKRGLNAKEWIRKSGINVHFKTPIRGKESNGFVQTDLMFGDPKWMAWSLRGGAEGSQYKGMHRHILMASIASAQGMKWSYQKGLIDRASDEVIATEPNEIAKLLLGKADGSALETVETILDEIKDRPNYEELVADARKTLAHYDVELP